MKENYGDLSDEALSLLAQEGDKEAERTLLLKYQNFVRFKAKDFFLMGGDREDLFQEGMIGLYKGIHSFKDTENTSFRGFVDLCIKRQLITVIRSANTKKNSPLNNYVSLNSQASEDLDRALEDILSVDSSSVDPEEIILIKETTSSMENLLKNNLSEFEWQILMEYLHGESYEDIGEKLKVSKKAVYNGIERVRRKVQLLMQERQ